MDFFFFTYRQFLNAVSIYDDFKALWTYIFICNCKYIYYFLLWPQQDNPNCHRLQCASCPQELVYKAEMP